MSENNKKVVIFDFDGVIADTFSFCYKIRNEFSPLTQDEYRKWFEGNINDVLKIKPHPNFFDSYTPQLLNCPPKEEVVETIKKLAKHKVLVIVSSTITSSIKPYLDNFGLTDYFKEILGNEIESSKIKKLQMVLGKYSISPSDTVYITDTLGDIKEAEKCGIKSIAVSWGYHPIETLERGKPYRIVNTPEEMLGAINSLENTN